MNGKIILKTPFLCICVIKIDGKMKKLNPFKIKNIVELPLGNHKINVGVEYSDTGHIGMDHGHSHWEDENWAWEKDQEILVTEIPTIIKIKRKWHLTKPITAVATIINR